MSGHASSGNAEPYGRTKSCAEFKRSLSSAVEANWALGNACCSRGSGAGAESVAGKPVSRKITLLDCADAVLNPSRRTVKRGNLRFILASGVQILINGGFRVHARDSVASIFAPPGLEHCPDPTQGLGPGLQSYAASRLGWVRAT